MKVVLRSIVLLSLPLAAAYGDELRLRDGKVISGYYVGGNQKELWFQSNGVGADVYPTMVVQSLQFGGLTGMLGYSKPPEAARPVPAQAKPGFWRSKFQLVRMYLACVLFPVLAT